MQVLEFYSLSMEQLNSSHNHHFWLLLIHTTMNHKEITDLHKNPMLRKQTGSRHKEKKKRVIRRISEYSKLT